MKSTKAPNIVWLASYPKSGNTWFRVFLSNLLMESDQPADINNLFNSQIASSRQLFDDISGIPSADLTPDEIDNIRADVYRMEASETEEILYHKIHDAFRISSLGISLIAEDITKAVLYFIRNPLDIAVSFSNHLGIDVDKTIHIMNDDTYAFCSYNDRLQNQIRQVLMSWSGHVRSWVDHSKLPLKVVRYEDMLDHGMETFRQAALFIGLNPTQEELAAAIAKSAFENLKKQEMEKGFREKNIRSGSFFRKGNSGDWKNILSKKQIDRIIMNHKGIMHQFGYYPLE